MVIFYYIQFVILIGVLITLGFVTVGLLKLHREIKRDIAEQENEDL